ncbi:hypothetical protein [Phenylobacterium sp.]|uniref:hypothetical protein n=1 Tax=Phenylobacterium sp. TaxID=1871053 RepID=UPI0025DB6276|nr:hypothetical protein [Phenylobacterium sp.]
MRSILPAALLLTLGVLTGAPAAARDCDRACVAGVTDAVLAALRSGDPGKVLPRGVRITENGRDIRLADSQLHAIGKILYRHDFAEPAAGAAGVNGAAEAAGGPEVFSLRLKLKGDRVDEVETVVTRRTEASIFAPQTMAGKPEWDQELPPPRRTPRETMIAAANAYFDGIQAADGAAVAAAPGCNRYENGARTTNRPGGPQDGCKGLSGFGYIQRVRDRRFPLADEARGLVWALVVFDIPGGPYEVKVDGQVRKLVREPRSILIGELFKIDAGQIQDIEVVMRNAPLAAGAGWAPPKKKK